MVLIRQKENRGFLTSDGHSTVNNNPLFCGGVHYASLWGMHITFFGIYDSPPYRCLYSSYNNSTHKTFETIANVSWCTFIRTRSALNEYYLLWNYYPPPYCLYFGKINTYTGSALTRNSKSVSGITEHYIMI